MSFLSSLCSDRAALSNAFVQWFYIFGTNSIGAKFVWEDIKTSLFHLNFNSPHNCIYTAL